MGGIVLLLAGAVVGGDKADAGGDKKADEGMKLRYLRPSKEKGGWVLESLVTQRRDAKGSVYTSVTDRGNEKMTLKVQRDKDGNVLSAETLHESRQGKKKAVLTVARGVASLRREGGVAEKLDLPGDAVVTTAPDWSDIFEVVRRYDRASGGKQEFPGLWFHPVMPHRTLKFTAEKLGQDEVSVDGNKRTLDRYRVELRSGGYLVWADGGGRVIKLCSEKTPANAVVLDGFEEATKALK
jgi:hypothetical protein